jgi:hypothetical protein
VQQLGCRWMDGIDIQYLGFKKLCRKILSFIKI